MSFICLPCSKIRSTDNAKQGFDSYQKFRASIQFMIDKKIELLLKECWNKEIVDAEKYKAYIKHMQV